MTQQSKVREVLEIALKKAMAYAFDKGYTNDHKPDHEKANAIRDEAEQALYDAMREVILKTHEIYLTKENVAAGDLGDDVVRHWNMLRERQLADLDALFGKDNGSKSV